MPKVDPATALRTIERSEQLDDICERRGVGVLTVFGSVARGEPDPQDLDVAYAAAAGTPVDVLGLLADLVDLTGTDRIDLLDLDRAGVVAAQRALTQCVPLYEDLPGHYAELQIRAIVMYADTKWLRDAQLRALAAG